VQIFLHEKPPGEAELADANEMADFLGQVVGEEDMPMSRSQQFALGSGLLRRVQVGRNEGGIQHFHACIQRYLDD
jgi:carnitine monooxygenase subunit